uniref:DHC_N2 domain-containing protein n=1 Tax=Glossina brevipalpis TaxID=37001 RepID=A0A1A9WUA4_9MUSC
MGQTLSLRQELFELEPLSLEFLNSIIASCSPYKNLWYSCLDLVKLEEATIGNPLVNVEVDDVWMSLETIKTSLQNSLIVFEEKPEIQDVATHYLAQLETFLPKVTAIEDVKNENWLFQHWQELANRSGLDIKYSLAMNFQYLIRKGIMDHLELVHEISEKAENEADAIRRAAEEEERRKEEEEQALILRKAMHAFATTEESFTKLVDLSKSTEVGSSIGKNLSVSENEETFKGITQSSSTTLTEYEENVIALDDDDEDNNTLQKAQLVDESSQKPISVSTNANGNIEKREKDNECKTNESHPVNNGDVETLVEDIVPDEETISLTLNQNGNMQAEELGLPPDLYNARQVNSERSSSENLYFRFQRGIGGKF